MHWILPDGARGHHRAPMHVALPLALLVIFSVAWMRRPITIDFVYATGCLILAAYFMFRGGIGETAAPG